MGQVVGHMPYTWNDLLEEKDRVLYWSGEVLSKVADNVHQEESLLTDYSNEVIDEKVNLWIEANLIRIESILRKRRNVPEGWRTRVLITIPKVTNSVGFRKIGNRVNKTMLFNSTRYARTIILYNFLLYDFVFNCR